MEAGRGIGIVRQGANALDERLLRVREALLVPVAALAAEEVVALLTIHGRRVEPLADSAADPAEKLERERAVEVVALRAQHTVDGLDAFENTGTGHGGERGNGV